MLAFSARNYKTLLLASLSLAWFLLLSIIYWLWVGYGINISFLLLYYILMSWPREISLCWTTFSHAVHISSAEFFPPYFNIELTRALDITNFVFSFLEVAHFTMYAWIHLPLPEILPLPEPLPLPETPLPLPMAVDCRRWHQPYFLLGRISLSLRCRRSTLLGLGTLRTLWIFGGCHLVSLCL